jgi:hypothetical protein
MNRMIRMSLAPLFGAAAAIASSQTLTAGENLVFSPPKNFAVGYTSSHDNRVMTEYVPDGQTVDDWTQLVTVQIFHGATVDPATF